MGETTVKGVEAIVAVGKEQGIRGRFSYAYADVNVQHAGFADNSPRHLIKANVLVPLGSDRYTVAVEAQYVSSRLDMVGEQVDAYWISNINLFARPLNDQFDLSFGVYNVFDEKYFDPASSLPFQTEQDGRTVRLKMTYRF